jgi:(p)ppGpp synthase/HD superfamily hydrolase
VVQTNAVENWLTFERRIAGFSARDRRDIHFAYQLAKYAHRGQMRVSKERYFEHLRAVALIVLDECGIEDACLVIGALLHDSIEDTGVFGNAQRMSLDEWMLEARERLTLNFGAESAEIVLAVTKPKVNGIDIRTKAEALDAYYEQLHGASGKALLVKMADRLHNLRTQYATPPEKQARKARETAEIYFPIFQRVLRSYPGPGRYMLEQMEEALQTLGRPDPSESGSGSTAPGSRGQPVTQHVDLA